MNQNGIELQVCADGKPIREYGHEGQLFVEGRKGSAFTLKIKNNKHERALIVVLVDGTNVVSGDAEKVKGYIVPGLSSYEIQGWRTSLNDVSTFVFKDKTGSYTAATTGSTKMCGLISVIAYDERKENVVVQERVVHHWHEPAVMPVPYPVPVYPRPYQYPPYYYGASYGVNSTGAVDGSITYTAGCLGTNGNQGNEGIQVSFSSGLERSVDMASLSSDLSLKSSVTASASASSLSANALSLGAAWGPQKQDRVTESEFRIGSVVVTMEMYYTDAKGLKKLGIDTKKVPTISKSPLPSVLTGFCRPPL